MARQNREGKLRATAPAEFTHLDPEGRPRMVNVGAKPETQREAVASGTVRMSATTLGAIARGQVAKGDVLSVAQVAATMAAKRTSDLIPMCHQLLLDAVEVTFNLDDERAAVEIVAAVRTAGKTGVEMEALTAVSVAALTIYDMCKALDRGMIIDEIKLLQKTGGKSGRWERSAASS